VQLQKTSGCETYTIVSHQHSTIRRTGQRLILLYQGKVRWQGSVDDLDSSDNAYLDQFLHGSVDGPMEIIGRHI
jgi:phospholipid/cholesterol/gamma-HCH transport system ATP-binding protein